MGSFFDKYIDSVRETETILYTGKVMSVRGMLIESTGPRSVIGEMCTIGQHLGQLVSAEDDVVDPALQYLLRSRAVGYRRERLRDLGAESVSVRRVVLEVAVKFDVFGLFALNHELAGDPARSPRDVGAS